jgi:class 3 adenylate cyclase
MSVVRTQYAEADGASIAYQVIGDGPVDVVYVPGWVSNIEVAWEDPSMARFLRRLASFSRLILFDKRGTGLSDPVSLRELPTIEIRMDDVRAVMDAVGSRTATLVGHSEGGNMCSVFAATYPQRTDRVVLIGSYAKRIWSEDYPWAPRGDDREQEISRIEETFGDPSHLPEWIAPSRMGDPAFREWWARYFRFSSSPRAAAHLMRINTETDTRAALPLISAPTLCLYRSGDRDVSVDEGRWIAEQIPDASFVEIAGEDHIINGQGMEQILEEIERFVVGEVPLGSSDSDRSLATVMFTDIVRSTELAASMGDSRWSEVLEQHHIATRREVAAHRGQAVSETGDGFLATFDGPARAVRAALAVHQAMRSVGLDVRIGIHTGEVQHLGLNVAGLAVHIGARVTAVADAGEVLVSRTVRDLIVGSGIQLESRGAHTLKGVPDDWELFAVSAEA